MTKTSRVETLSELEHARGYLEDGGLREGPSYELLELPNIRPQQLECGILTTLTCLSKLIAFKKTLLASTVLAVQVFDNKSLVSKRVDDCLPLDLDLDCQHLVCLKAPGSVDLAVAPAIYLGNQLVFAIRELPR